MKSVEGSQLEPSSNALEVLNNLSDDPTSIVFVVSSESKRQLHKWYHKKAPKLGLAAENGAFWRWTQLGKGLDDWNSLVELDDFTWIKQVRQIMNGYVQKTDGSYFE